MVNKASRVGSARKVARMHLASRWEVQSASGAGHAFTVVLSNGEGTRTLFIKGPRGVQVQVERTGDDSVWLRAWDRDFPIISGPVYFDRKGFMERDSVRELKREGFAHPVQL